MQLETRKPKPTEMATAKTTPIENGTIREINGHEHIFYDEYWIRYYRPPQETLAEKKKLLDALTRRTFHHTERGINTPGEKLDKVRAAYENESDPARKRVNAAMLAGALFNRATDIFTAIVDLEYSGIQITDDDDLMCQCSLCFTEALSLSENVRHYSGEEGVDELWGEPGKVFTMSIADYYCSRYRKIAQAMREIDCIGETIQSTLCYLHWFSRATPLIDDFINIAKCECEILRGDPKYLKVWPEFVADGEKIHAFRATIPEQASTEMERHIKHGTNLLHTGKNLIAWIASVRVPMPKSTTSYLKDCAKYHQSTKKFV